MPSPRLLNLVFAATLIAAAGTAHAERIQLPALDLAKLASEDLARQGKPGVPLRYGQEHVFAGKAADIAPGLDGSGTWLPSRSGEARWSLELAGPQAHNLALYFDRFRLPAGAALEIYAGNDKQPSLRFDDRDNAAGGDLRTPMLLSDSVRVLLRVPEGLRDVTQLRLHSVVQGYRDPFKALSQAKSGSCNIDIACPEGDAWRSQSRAVAHYTFVDSIQGPSVCTGQLVATGNATQDVSAPRFLTAHHCVDVASEAPTMTFYWKYESASCRTPGSGASGTPLPRTIAAATQSGATLLATHTPTDFTVLGLNAPVPAAADSYYSGWDRSGAIPVGAVSIHHPAGHEKRIAIDLDPLTRTPSCIIVGASATTHWRVGAWNSGTTEGGSSGAGLWHPQSKRLIGVLSGGNASCSLRNEFDCFGALDRAWDGAGSAATRMRDWMDRTGSAPQFIEGHSGCSAPSVSLNSVAFTTPPSAGELVTFSASASGGSGGGYVYEWDLDGDGVFERRGSAASVSVRYARAQSNQVRLRVTDSLACPASTSRALDVRVPRIVASSAAPVQACGNGNAGLDPGERWSLPVTLTNTGAAALPAGAHALFANGLVVASLPGGVGPNTFGYQGTTSAAAPGQCGYAFIDIGDAPALSLTDLDDGRGLVALGGAGVRLYGETFTQASMTTNGYVSFSTADIGADFDNSCTGELNRGGVGPRLHVLHDDLEVRSGGGLRYRYYPTCPRTAAVGGAQPCHVFQWDGLMLFDGGGDASFQAVAYATSGEVAYQYRRADPMNGSGATIGVIDRSGNDPLNVRCNSAGAAPSSSAICIFEPQNLPVQAQAGLLLERPALALPALAPGASTTVQVPVRVTEGSACGAPVAIDYIASAGSGLHSMEPSRVFSGQLAAGCSAVSTCPAQSAPAQPRRGFFNDPARPGNGLAVFQYGDPANPVTGAIWYTGDDAYLSDWYTFAGAWRSGLVDSSLFRSRNLQPTGFQPESSPIGRTWLASIDARTQLFAWDFGGGRRGAELMSTTAGSLPFASPDHTNAWIQSGQAGWGLGIEGVQLSDGPLEFFGVYLYDANGVSRWLSGTSRSTASGRVDLLSQRVHCPGCPFYPDYDSLAQAAGFLDRNYTSRIRAQMSTSINLPAPLSGSWNRSTVVLEAFGVTE
jgi:lysyl endopeptidase